MSTLKVVVSGSRGISGEEAYAVFKEHMSDSLTKHTNSSLAKKSGYASIIILHGGAIGVDQLASRYARENALKCREFKPIYLHKFDAKAPKKRNVEMAEAGDILVALWNGSPGTRHMIKTMEKEKKKPVYVKKYKG